MKRKRDAQSGQENLELNGGRHAIANGKDLDEEEGSTIALSPEKSKQHLSNGVLRKKAETPRKQKLVDNNKETPTRPTKSSPLKNVVTNADRSAIRKSARLLINQATNGFGSEDEDSQDELLAQEIFDEEEDAAGGKQEDVEEDDNEEASGILAEDQVLDGLAQHDDALLPETPSKRKRGRPKGWKKQRTPTPPPDLPLYEHYFFQNRPGGSKASDNRLPSSALISHEDYFTTTTSWRDPHEGARDFLHALHAQSFDQWIFEIDQGFNICTYGYGSKRELLLDFAQHLSTVYQDRKIIIINGHNAALTPRDILTTIASTIPSLNTGTSTTKLGSRPQDALSTILKALSPPPSLLEAEQLPTDAQTTLLVHSIDSSALRRPQSQSILSALASHPSISIVASADTPNFPLLWDSSTLSSYNFVFHDCTIFAPFDLEISLSSATGGGVVDEVNSLLGRSGRKIQGREGVMYVLKSLTQSARSLYSLLVAEVLSLDAEDESADLLNATNFGDGTNKQLPPLMEDEDENTENDDDENDNNDTPGRQGRKGNTNKNRNANTGSNAAIAYRTLYTKAVSGFIATNEASFRGLLKEFHDHEMITSRRDAAGIEYLSVPFRREEMEGLLEELMGDV